MRPKPEYRDRDESEVAVLDALADNNGEGMTVFDLRAVVEVDIDSLEDALSALKDDGLIEVSVEKEQTIITVDERVIGPEETDKGDGFFTVLRRRLRL